MRAVILTADCPLSESQLQTETGAHVAHKTSTARCDYITQIIMLEAGQLCQNPIMTLLALGHHTSPHSCTTEPKADAHKRALRVVALNLNCRNKLQVNKVKQKSKKFTSVLTHCK